MRNLQELMDWKRAWDTILLALGYPRFVLRRVPVRHRLSITRPRFFLYDRKWHCVMFVGSEMAASEFVNHHLRISHAIVGNDPSRYEDRRAV